MRVLLDTNIIVDVLQRRDPWRKDGEKIFIAAALKQITACVTSKQIADIHYLTKKTLKGQKQADDLSKQIICKLLAFIELVDARAVDCQSAIGIDNDDFEDAMLITCAARESMDYIITRNSEHFAPSPVPAISPAGFVKLLHRDGID